KPVLGVVYLPAKRELYFGTSAIGARHVGGPGLHEVRDAIAARPRAAVEAALDRSVRLPLGKPEDGRAMKIVQSSSHASREESEFFSALQARGWEIEVASAGSSLKFCRVADGSADLYPRFGPTMEWDTAAGQCIAEEGGAEVVTVEQGLPPGYNKVSLRNGPFLVLGPRFRAGLWEREAVLHSAAALDSRRRTPIR
ncbi:MAG: inositol monophosphatase family protein, partial [Acidobacteriota bacterium]